MCPLLSFLMMKLYALPTPPISTGPTHDHYWRSPTRSHRGRRMGPFQVSVVVSTLYGVGPVRRWPRVSKAVTPRRPWRRLWPRAILQEGRRKVDCLPVQSHLRVLRRNLWPHPLLGNAHWIHWQNKWDKVNKEQKKKVCLQTLQQEEVGIPTWRREKENWLLCSTTSS